ncbi:Uncharacterized protein FWK35_00008424 [Aphis craccivora]|uniref:MULE domain-containing protein n=1 Tax=Aphis craccivora TaxID=307492 RepID=A0A6G0YW57_APHCR|nr:Uncharacterized protein FWK35_00008424 [Aphis craccivora]
MVHLDFEKSAHNAVLKVFKNCQMVGCRFHLSQAWFRTNAGKTVVYQWLQKKLIDYLICNFHYIADIKLNDSIYYGGRTTKKQWGGEVALAYEGLSILKFKVDLGKFI